MKTVEQPHIKQQVHMHAPFTRRSLLVAFVALLYIVLWGSAFIASKIGIMYSPPLSLFALRFLVSAAIMACIAWIKRLAWPRGSGAWGRLILFGLLNSAVFLGCTSEALRFISSGMGAIIAATNPLILTLVAPLVLGERLTWLRAVGLVLGFGGVVVVMWTRIHSHEAAGGVLLAFVGVVGLVCATLFYKRYPPVEHPFVVNAVQLGAAGIVLLPALFFEHAWQTTFTLALLEAFLYLVLVMSIGASLLWFWLLQQGGASVVSSYYFLTPIVGLALAALLLREPFGLRDIFGLIMAALGIACIHRPAPAPRQVSEDSASSQAHMDTRSAP